ncbi:MAG: crotonase/enoyl-CoA hydratase family protein [Actinomycetota bacterium]|nr:crotonase/enoyl-CoA hydratase family protein [Actinomycetota bacterium]
MSERVRCTIGDGVADVRLNRPEKRNAIDLAMFNALIDTGEALRDDRSLRAVVLSGAGRSFCAGLDLAAFGGQGGENGAGGGSFADGALARRDGQIASVAQRAVTVWSAVAAPVIAAVHGHALGGGLQLALGADIRIVAPDARLSVLEVRWGLIPDMTGTQVLPGLVGLDVAKELTFTGRMVTGEEAVRLGLATRLSETPREDALALAREIAAKSPSAVRAAKSLLDSAAQMSIGEGLLAEQRAQRNLIGSADQVEAMMAFIEGRAPRWSS